MADEHEWPELNRALGRGVRSIIDARRRGGTSLAHEMEPGRLRAHYAEALDAYERMAGVREEDPRVLWHHRTALYGPPCAACGKPLRTPRAKLCAACGHRP